MHSIFVQCLFLILIILALNLIADKLRPAYPIVLVVGGLALSFTTQFSGISIHPEPSSLSSFRRCFTKRPGKYRGKSFGVAAVDCGYLSLIDMEEFKLREERLTNGES